MKRILYVEDTISTQFVVKKHLAELAQVSVASNLADARHELRAGKYDLLVSDVYMPDGSAVDFVQEIRRTLSPTELPIILVSSGMDQVLRIRALRAGANDCFPMPTPWAPFLESIRRMLNEPYVTNPNPDSILVTWVEGKLENRVWLFCPELNVCLHGEDSLALRHDMTERVRELARTASPLPFASDVRISEHLLKL